jgi:hypothetical protein
LTELVLSNPDCGREFIFESFQVISTFVIYGLYNTRIVHQTLNRSVTSQYQKVAIIMYLQPWLFLVEQYYEFSIRAHAQIAHPHSDMSESSLNSALDNMSTPVKSMETTQLTPAPPKHRSNSVAMSLPPQFTPNLTRRSSAPNVSEESDALQSQNATHRNTAGRVFDMPLEEFNGLLDDIFEVMLLHTTTITTTSKYIYLNYEIITL